jgi:hypothetical protein
MAAALRMERSAGATLRGITGIVRLPKHPVVPMGLDMSEGERTPAKGRCQRMLTALRLLRGCLFTLHTTPS